MGRYPNLRLRYPVELNLHGDAVETLRALLPLLERQLDRSWQDDIVQQKAEWRETLKGRAMVEANPVNPQRVVYEMSPLLPADAIVTSDSGSCANWYARDYQVKAGQRASLSGGLASMGAAVPYAIAAKFAQPIALVLAETFEAARFAASLVEVTRRRAMEQDANPGKVRAPTSRLCRSRCAQDGPACSSLRTIAQWALPAWSTGIHGGGRSMI